LKKLTKKQRERIYQQRITMFLGMDFDKGKVFLTKPQAIELLEKREVRINPLLTIALHEDFSIYGV
tara:strand:+ start:67 stop:264 length:198 start_codon:yes stop_codon:yes gene_type:complete